MSNYFYVAPEQLIRDRAEFAQKGIARGRSIVAAIYDVGIIMVAENQSASLYKISEIYDRIAFAGVGRYNEFDRLREAGIRWADSTGFTYSRGDVDARALANFYAQHLGSTAWPTRARSRTNRATPSSVATPRRSRGVSPPPKSTWSLWGPH